MHTNSIEEILAEFGRKCSPVATLRNVDNPLVRREYVDEATQAIQTIIDKQVIKAKTKVWEEVDSLAISYNSYRMSDIAEARTAELKKKAEL